LEEEKVTLKSGKCVVIKLPPMTYDFMYNLQKMTVKQAVVDPAVMALLTIDDVQELFLAVSRINERYWAEKAREILGGEK
jgi:hypothetical protein